MVEHLGSEIVLIDHVLDRDHLQLVGFLASPFSFTTPAAFTVLSTSAEGSSKQIRRPSSAFLLFIRRFSRSTSFTVGGSSRLTAYKALQ